jgi:hypothetical protein
MQPGFDIDQLDYSALTKKSLDQIAGNERSPEWESNRKTPVLKGAEWLFKDDKKPGRLAKRAQADAKSTPRKRSKKKRKARSAA